MSDWLIGRFDLTPEQIKVKRIAPRESTLVLGLPGSGKTQVLVQRADYLIQSQKISVQKIRLYVSTDVMENFIRQEIKSLGYPEEIVTTFDQWCHSFYVENISQDLPRIYINGRVDFKKIHSAALSAIQKNRYLRKSLEFALVDDGQDMTPNAFKVLSMAAQHLTVFADPHLKLSREGASESQMIETLELNMGRQVLRGDYRCSSSVAELASFFIEDENFRDAYLSEVRFDENTSEDFLCFIAPSEEKELNQLSHFILQRLVMKDKVGILVPTDKLVHRLAKALEDRGIETEKAVPWSAQNVIHRPYDFNNYLPKLTTYSMARGLTFNSVFMPRLVENAFSKITPLLRNLHLFVGITRASKWVYMSTVQGQEFEEITKLKSAEIEGKIRIIDKTPYIK
jgi:superfamily I DNA/RNA helicase